MTSVSTGSRVKPPMKKPSQAHCDEITERLNRGYAIENLFEIASIAESAALALERRADELACIHTDQIQAIWRELSGAMNKFCPPTLGRKGDGR
jgi:hypothetical protein